VNPDRLAGIAQALPDYEVSDEVGRGEFGVVWRARHRHLGREVAIKELATSMPGEHSERFRREARLLAHLDHPHIVKVFDYREVGERRLLIMELLRGGTLAQRRSEMSVADVLTSGIAAAKGLQHAHERGVLHRDVKPENLMFDHVGTLKVTDLGIAGGLGSEAGSMNITRAGSFLGTPAYVAPEQAAFGLGDGREPVAAASDQYGLAATLYEVLSGRLTHDTTGGALALCQRRMQEPAVPIMDVVPSLPVTVGHVLMRALERDPRDRFSSIGAFAEALRQGVVEAFADAAIPDVDAPVPTVAATVIDMNVGSILDREYGNLPPTPTTLIGRDTALDELMRLLAQHRLITITAAGGTGKTRLAVEVARKRVSSTAEGVWFVDLSTVANGRDVPGAVARVLGCQDDSAAAVIERLVDRLLESRALIVLDNCEHVVEAAADLAETLLSRCPSVALLATSREPLHIGFEHVYRLSPLAVAPEGASLGDLIAADATRLFAARARARQATFDITTSNAAAVDAIVRRLDGLPLALELAAARMRSMSAAEIADRLDERFRLLTTGERGLDERQRTLRGAIGWSYALLERQEQRALCRASVFVGGFDLDAGEAVLRTDASGDVFDVLDLIDALVEKSLLQREDDPTGHSRYRMLESIREYAAEQLADAHPADHDVVDAHLDHYLALAETNGPLLVGPEQIHANIRLHVEHDNLIAALNASTTLANGVSRGLRLVTALRYYWTRQSVASEVIGPVELLCLRSSDAADGSGGYAILARAYCGLGRTRDALEAGRRSVEMARPLGPTITWCRALQSRALAASYAGNVESALADIDELCAVADQLGAAVIHAEALSMRATALRSIGDSVAARAECRKVVEVYRATGEVYGLAGELVNLADYALEADDIDDAMACLHEAEPLADQLDSPGLTSYVYGNWGLVALRIGRDDEASDNFAKAIAVCARINDRQSLLNNLIGYVHVVARSDPHTAACLLAASDAMASRFGLVADPNEERLRIATDAGLRSTLSPTALDRARQDGAGLTTREIAALVSDHRS